jgi:hypothetical protein
MVILVGLACGLAVGFSCHSAGHGSSPRDGSAVEDSQDTGIVRVAMVSGIYRINDLVRLEPSALAPNTTTLASTVVGLSSIEKVVRSDQGDYQVATITPPAVAGCKPFPMSIARFDAANHGRRDVLVADDCADWMALDDGAGGFTVERADSLFTAPLPIEVILVIDTANSGRVVASADNQEVLVLFNQMVEPGKSTPWTFVVGSSGREVLPSPVTNIVVGWGLQDGNPTGCLVQTFGELFACPDFSTASAGSPAVPSGSWTLSAPELPYVQAFDAFDHLQALALPGCQDSLLGIGVFSTLAGTVPRKLQHVTLDQGGQFSQTEIATPFSVTTFGVIAETDGSALVGMLGEDSEGTVFGLAEVRACNTWTLLGTWQADGNWRTPEAPQFLAAGPRVPMTPGIALTGFTAPVDGADGYVFVNYDGYTIRAWEFTASSMGSSSLQPQIIVWSAHDTRTDLVFAP